MSTQTRLPHVLLLSESDQLAALDRRALRDAGVSRVTVMTSGVDAARFLAAPPHSNPPHADQPRPDVIVCAQRLADMDGEQFCAILRLHPSLMGLPVLLLLPNDSEVEQLRTLGCGASALLARPYSVQDMRTQISSLAGAQSRLDQLDKAEHLTDTQAFDAALATYGMLLKPVRQPEDYFRVGMQCLQEQRWNSAINAFQRALRNAQIKGEAELGMAAAWRGKGDYARCRTYLAQAAATFVRARRWHRARAVFARLLAEDASAQSPFLATARQFMRQGRYDEAAEALAEGYEVSDKDQIRDKLAQTCMTAQAPEHMLERLESCLCKTLGTRGQELGGDIRQCLDTLIEEQEERRRQASSERQRDVSRRMALQKEAKEARTESEDSAEASAPAPLIQAMPLGRPRTSGLSGASVPEAREPMPKLSLLDDDLPVQQRPGLRSGPGQAGQPSGQQPGQQSDLLPVLEALSEEEATSGLFTGSPGINEFLSVMKCTWKLARRDK